MGRVEGKGVAWGLIGAGALFALAVATKVQYVVALPAFLLYLGWWGWEMRGKGGEASARARVVGGWAGGWVAAFDGLQRGGFWVAFEHRVRG